MFSMEKETKMVKWEQDCSCTTQNSQEIEIVSDRMSYIVLKGRWCNVIVLNVHSPSEEKSDESKDSF